MCGRRQGDNWVVDRIELEGMVFSGRHGVRPAEREHSQEFRVDVKLDTDLVEAGRSDKVEDTVDYRLVYAIAREVIEGESVQLIETLAHRIAERVLDLKKVVGVSIRIAKRPESMRPIDAAAVKIRRTRA
jgi:7,8-dihydroneopterin aldolase/epimerase/oxygenase